MKSPLVATILWIALCLSAQAQPQCPSTPATGTSNTMCASTAFVTKGLTNADAGNLTTGILPPGRTDGHMDGTVTNDSAAAGEVGEIMNPVAGPGTVPLTSGVGTNLTSVVLTPGDWLLFTVATFTPDATTSITRAQVATSGTSGLISTGQNAWQGNVWPAFVPGAVNFSLRTGPQRQTVAPATTLTIYVNVQVDFTVSTMTAGANLIAIRRR